VDTAQAAYEAAVSPYVDACTWDVVLKQLLPIYKAYKDDYAAFVSSSEREKAAFRFKKPVNPYQSTVNILKNYKPGTNDASIA